jgi:enhancer of polycomb-like protein
VKQRETAKKDQLIIDKQLFEQRNSLRQLKQNLPAPYKEGDEDLLVTQKVNTQNPDLEHHTRTDDEQPQKKKPPETISQRPPGTQFRLPSRQDSRSAESDLVLLSDILAEKENMLQQEIEARLAQYKKWSEVYVDLTRAPLTPVTEENTKTSFRPAMAEYLPTPPASISSDHMGDAAADDASPTNCKDDLITVRYASSLRDGPSQSQPSFRRRFGRGGRLMIDRRGMRLRPMEVLDDVLVDRFMFDHDDDDDEIPVYGIDPFDIARMRYRAKIAGSHLGQVHASRRAQIESGPTNQQASTPVPDLPFHSGRSKPFGFIPRR